MLLKAIIWLFCSPLLLHAADLQTQRLSWQLEAGDVRNIAGFCRQHVQAQLGREKNLAQSLDKLMEDQELRLTCYMAHFFGAVGRERTFILPDLKDKEYVGWLLKHPEVFEKLCFAGASGKETLTVLRSIWLMEGRELSGIGLNMALGAALISTDRDVQGCLDRYAFYKKSFADKKLFSQFLTLEPWEFGILFRGRESLDELAWAQEYSDGKKSFKADTAGSSACSFVPYRSKNKKGVSVHAGSAFYDHKPITLQVYVEYGGVCGAVSKGCSGFAKSRGVPSYAIGQPGHCALIWKGADGKWKIGNNIYGWAWSTGSPGGAWKGPVSLIMALALFQERPEASSSSLCYHLSLLAVNPQQADVLLRAALQKNSANYPAWQVLMKKNARKSNDQDKLALLEKLHEAFPDNPAVWEYLLKGELGLDWKKTDAYAAYARLISLTESKDSVDVYMRNFSILARKDIPTMEAQLAYTVKTRKAFFTKWADYCKENKTDRKTRVQICSVLEKALAGLVDYPKTAGSMIALYGQVLEIWNDRQLLGRANTFITAQLVRVQKPELRKQWLSTGLKLADLLQDKKSMVRYAEALQD